VADITAPSIAPFLTPTDLSESFASQEVVGKGIMSRDVGQESLFRSATMSLIQLFIPAEVAHATVSELGELGNVQFKDVSGMRELTTV
jgi:hypothetical protein